MAPAWSTHKSGMTTTTTASMSRYLVKKTPIFSVIPWSLLLLFMSLSSFSALRRSNDTDSSVPGTHSPESSLTQLAVLRKAILTPLAVSRGYPKGSLDSFTQIGRRYRTNPKTETRELLSGFSGDQRIAVRAASQGVVNSVFRTPLFPSRIRSDSPSDRRDRMPTRIPRMRGASRRPLPSYLAASRDLNPKALPRQIIRPYRRPSPQLRGACNCSRKGAAMR